MKSYGNVNSSWNKAKFRSLLEYASNMCKIHNEPVYVGIDWNEIILSTRSESYPFYILACTVTKPIVTEEIKKYNQEKIIEHLKKEFEDDACNCYTLDEMVPRVHDCIVYGIKRYGQLTGSMDSDKITKKLFHAFTDAHNMINLHKKPFVLGYCKDELVIAPISKISRFIDPLACIIGNNKRCWNVSDMHSYVLSSNPTDKSLHEQLSNAIISKERKYGAFDAEQTNCIIKLENAFEDAAKMSSFFNEEFSIGLTRSYSEKENKYYDAIKVCKNTHGLDNSFVTVRPNEFLDSSILCVDEIKNVAKKTFALFCVRYESRQITKSYGKLDSSWDKNKIKDMLQDASNMAKKHNMSFFIHKDEECSIVLIPNLWGCYPYIPVCGITPRKKLDHWKDRFSQEEIEKMLKEEFWDEVAFSGYTIDEMVPRAYDCLTKGIIEYGGLGFLSEGRIQLSGAFSDAKKLAMKHNKPFILGYGKGGIAIAPLSEKSRFVESLSCIVTKNGTWSISDIHCTRHEFYDGDFQYAILGEKKYGRFESDYNSCVIKLENAFEDAAKMSQIENCPTSVIMSTYGEIAVLFNKSGTQRITPEISIKVFYNTFMDGKILSLDKIKDAANNAYEKFSKLSKHTR